MDFTNFHLDHLDSATVEIDSMGHKNMYVGGQQIATQKPGIFPETTSTYEAGQKVAETRDNIIDGSDIIQGSEQTGIIKEDVNGNVSLYDPNYNKMAYVDPEGNIKSVMNHSDPLSQVDRVNFQQLKFYSEG